MTPLRICQSAGLTPSPEFALVDGTNTFTAAGQDSAGRTDSHTVAVRLPASAGNQYDGSGNLTSDGSLTFTYDWDGRLESYQVPYVWKVSFFYDGLGRLRFTREEVWESTGWVMRGEKRYLYDGYLAIQERDQNNVPTVTYTRGWDLSGTCCDAMGGIGGLLARTDHSALLGGAAEPHAYYHADGSGNVTMLIDSLDRPVAKYLYDPYGNLVSQSGPLAEANVYRFSSKAYDPRSGLYNFGRRFYAPSLQRWMSRDPIGIEGGINLYGYVRNGPVNAFDAIGLADTATVSECAPMLVTLSRYAAAAWTTFKVVEFLPPNPGAIVTVGVVMIGGAAAYVPAWMVFGREDPNGTVWACHPGNINGPPIRLTAPIAVTGAMLGADPKRGTVFNATYRPGTKPSNAPTGTLPIDKDPRTKGDVHGIKDQLKPDGVGPGSYVGVSPAGDIIVTNPDGTAENLGPISSYQ